MTIQHGLLRSVRLTPFGTLACVLGLFHQFVAADTRPNILFIMTDQQHAGMMSCTGNPNLKTPALDALAASGTRFERAFATNPVCVPSRFSLQTGRMPSVIGMRQNESKRPVPEDMLKNSLGPLLRNAGYECAYGGKTHVPTSLTRYMFRAGYQQLTTDRRDELSRVCADFIRKPHDKPFFLFVSFINPHDICYMAINDYARSENKSIQQNEDSKICESVLDRARQSGDLTTFIHQHCPPTPDNLNPPANEPECIRKHYVWARPFRTFARNRWSNDMWRLHRWVYARLTERVDAQIGRVLESVKQAGIEENTLIVFTSDHGDMDSAHRLEHKSVLYEEAVRVPFLMSWKGHIPAGGVDTAHLISNGLDLLPTLCDYAGVDLKIDLPGRSVRPLVESTATPGDWRDFLVVESQNGRLVRTDRFKYSVFDCGEHREMFVDLNADPGEMINLAGSPTVQSEIHRHRQLLKDWMERWSDPQAADYTISGQ